MFTSAQQNAKKIVYFFLASFVLLLALSFLAIVVQVIFQIALFIAGIAVAAIFIAVAVVLINKVLNSIK